MRTTISCPFCSSSVLVMRALNGRQVVVDAESVDELLCRLADGRLDYDRSAGHRLHAKSCDSPRFDASAVIEAARRNHFREQHTAQKRVQLPAVPMTAFRELQLEITATPAMVKAAYRRLAFEYHPDRNPTGLERIQKINEAYDVLKRSGCA